MSMTFSSCSTLRNFGSSRQIRSDEKYSWVSFSFEPELILSSMLDFKMKI